MKNCSILILLFVLFASGAVAEAASGIRGRAAWRGEVGAGVTVRAYRTIADIPRDQPVAVSAPTALDGTYSLELPPGTYYLTARNYDKSPEPGKLFCYYSGAPVTVRENVWTNVGFNLVRIPKETPPESSPSSGIRGEITFQDTPLEKVYLYVYKDPGDGFKGPGYIIQPVEKGSFRLRLPPGDYWLLARKRAKGGQFGPIETGDYFNYYYGNPVRIEAGKTREIKLETITRLSMLEEGEMPFRGVRGLIRTGTNQPVAGLRVFAYRDAQMTGAPDFFSPPSGNDGRFELSLAGDGPFYLVARKDFGGPVEEGEYIGKMQGNAKIVLDSRHQVREVTINVEKKRL